MSDEEIPEHVQQARLNGDATPQGASTTTASDLGRPWLRSPITPPPGTILSPFVNLNAEPPSDQQT